MPVPVAVTVGEKLALRVAESDMLLEPVFEMEGIKVALAENEAVCDAVPVAVTVCAAV